MIHLKKLTLTLVALFAMTAGAWADGKVYTSAVDITALQVGDILAEGASINGSGTIIFDNNRVKVNGTLQTDGFCYLYTNDFDSFGAEGVISLSNNTTMSPVDKDNNDGNAWEVTNVENNNYIHIQGITYGPAAPAGTALTPDATRKIWTLAAMPANDVELQVEYYPAMLTLAASPADGGKVELDAAAAPVEWTPETWTNVSTEGQHDALTSGDITLSTTDGWLRKESDGNLNLYSADNEYYHQTLTFSTTGDGFTRIELTMTSDASNHNPHITPADGWTFSGKSAVWEGEATKSLVCQNCTTTVSKITFYRGSGLPTGVEKDETGNIYVKSGTTVTVKATPEVGYHLVSLSDGTNTYDVDADGIATVTMPDGDADLTLTATFSDEFELTFDDVNFKTNQNITVKVDDADKTPDQDGKLSVKSGQTVTLTAKQGYKFRSVEAKKVVPVKTFNCAGVELIYEDGDTWAKVIERNPGKIYDDSGWIGRSDTNFFLIEGEVLNNGNQIITTDKIVDPTATYSWQAG